MITFVTGLFFGSFTMVFIMSLMVAAKRGDQRMEAFVNKKIC